jgi:3-oxoacyl-[acyl-carrier protein] reductase
VADQKTGSLHFRPFDLGNLSEIPDFVRELRNEFGAIYGLINNAGLGTSEILATIPLQVRQVHEMFWT